MNNRLLYILFVLMLLSLLLFFATSTERVEAPVDGLVATSTPEEATSTELTEATSSTIDFSDTEWVESPVTPQGTQFSYPATLPTKYVSATEWPPLVELSAGDYTCEDGEILAADGPIKTQEKRLVGTQEYCLTTFVEGAAGSAYTNYDYSTEQGDFVVRVVFTLKTPQCANYEEPERAACEEEQASFSTDVLADRIAASLRML